MNRGNIMKAGAGVLLLFPVAVFIISHPTFYWRLACGLQFVAGWWLLARAYKEPQASPRRTVA